MASNTPSTLLQTIEADLSFGESWLENEALGGALFVWNLLKGAFIALGPVAGKLMTDVLTQAVQNASAGDSVEQIESAALNTASAEAKTALATAGSAVAQQLIIGIKANMTASAKPAA